MKREKKNYPKVVDSIKEKIISHFNENLSCILLYGSSRLKKEFWDLDILIILKEKKNSLPDLLFLRNITTLFKDQTLDMQLFYLKELESADSFSLDAHGAFFSQILKNSIVLFGKNPFLDFKPSDHLVTISLLNRIQRYVFQARQECFKKRKPNKDHNPRYHQKHARRIIIDLLMMREDYENISDARSIFERYFPETFSNKDWMLLDSVSDDVTEYIGLYEKIYDLALASSQLLVPNSSTKPLRWSLQSLTFEYIIPESAREAIILLDGLPRVPELAFTMNILASWGYAVFFPRLKGTWESDGVFLDHNPSRDVIDFAKKIIQGFKIENKTIKIPAVQVIGTSFGGLVALSASLDPSIKHCIALSPVCTFGSVTGIETMDTFLKKMFPGAYRYSSEDWTNLIEDKILSIDMTVKDKDFNPSKYSIIAGIHDDQVNHKVLASVCERLGIEMYSLPLGHLALHKNTRVVFPLIYNLLKK